jgi:hypothetical protein
MPCEQRLVAHAWASRAAGLADWAWTRLVNRTDVWGGYNPVQDRDRQITWADGTTVPLGSTTTRPAKAKRGQISLTLPVLACHFRATPEHIVGLHTTSPDNTCRWGAIEVDHQGATSIQPEVNFAAE